MAPSWRTDTTERQEIPPGENHKARSSLFFWDRRYGNLYETLALSIEGRYFLRRRAHFHPGESQQPSLLPRCVDQDLITSDQDHHFLPNRSTIRFPQWHPSHQESLHQVVACTFEEVAHRSHLLRRPQSTNWCSGFCCQKRRLRRRDSEVRTLEVRYISQVYKVHPQFHQCVAQPDSPDGIHPRLNRNPLLFDPSFVQICAFCYPCFHIVDCRACHIEIV